jgi:alpha-L-rhamnosidase
LLRPTQPRCEYLFDPIGIDERQPRLSWRLESPQRDQIQTAYQVQVAGSRAQLEAGDGLWWDSGRVESEENHAFYAGRPLASRDRAHWRVRLWDRNGAVSDHSVAATWEMGLLEKDDWSADWIEDPERADDESSSRPTYFRRELEVGPRLRQARIHASALGIYRLSVNGQPATDAVFRPGWTDYNLRTQYQTLDVTGLLTEGANAVGTVLADGWYAGHVGFLDRHVYGVVPKLLVQIELTYDDGHVDTIVSEPGWRCAYGPIVETDMQMGETYDARLEEPGWDRAGLDDASWRRAASASGARTHLVAERCEPVRATQEIHPISHRLLPGGATLFDLGQNMVGWIRLHLSAPAGRTLTLRHAEVLDDAGELYVTNLRAARATDHYVTRGGDVETHEPWFTFHGFRYVEVSGLEGELPETAVTGIVAHQDLARSGDFSCSDQLVNQLQRNIVWGQRGNFLEVPTDCPQRDERLGWMGDAQVFIRTGCWNMDCAAFFTKWMKDVADSVSPGGSFGDVIPSPRKGPGGGAWLDAAPAWGDAGVIVPWTLYHCYGDRRLLERSFDDAAGWVDHVHRHNPGLIWEHHLGNNYGDWLAVGEETPKLLVSTAFFAHSADLVARMAGVLGREREARRYRELFDRIRAVYERTYVGADGRVFGDTQTGYALTLRFNLVAEERRGTLASHLARRVEGAGRRLTSGFVGVEHLLFALSENGNPDLAYHLLCNRDYPSWLYAVEHGATTIWERWDGWTEERGFQTPAMNSFNHYAFGAVGSWLYQTVAGIDIGAPGYRRVRIAPTPGGGLTWARAYLDTVRGRVRCAWRTDEGGFELEVEVPAGSTAEIRLPVADPDRVRESGRTLGQAEGVHGAIRRDGAVTVETGSGVYRFHTE